MLSGNLCGRAAEALECQCQDSPEKKDCQEPRESWNMAKEPSCRNAFIFHTDVYGVKDCSSNTEYKQEHLKL